MDPIVEIVKYRLMEDPSWSRRLHRIEWYVRDSCLDIFQISVNCRSELVKPLRCYSILIVESYPNNYPTPPLYAVEPPGP